MAKRLTDNQKWSKPFIRSLKLPYKVLWLYILDECDHAGIWQVDFDVARIKVGCDEINIEDAKKYFGDKIILFDNDEKMFVQDFIDFQYGNLNPENRAHNSVIAILSKHKLNKKIKPLASPLQGCKDKDMDKDKDKDSIAPKFYREFNHLKISFDEFEKLKESGYSQIEIDEVFDAIENYKKNTQYTSLYLTASKWLKKQHPHISKVDNRPYTDIQLSEVRAQHASGFGFPEWFNIKHLDLL
jgi:hypothetical protein